jgi:hypothetical protein
VTPSNQGLHPSAHLLKATQPVTAVRLQDNSQYITLSVMLLLCATDCQQLHPLAQTHMLACGHLHPFALMKAFRTLVLLQADLVNVN